MRIRTRLYTLLVGWLVLFGLVSAPPPANAQAFCALRDPVAQIYRLFETTSSYRSIVRTVESDIFSEVSNRLGFGLHRSELGRHTIYLAASKQRPLGIVHVRSERSRWGLVEIAWALDPDLRIVDFEIQRCRSSRCSQMDSPDFRELVLGAGANELAGYLSEDGRQLIDTFGEDVVSGRARDLAAVVIRNGLKTIAVTDAGWGDIVASIQIPQATEATTNPAPASPSIE